MHLWPIGQGPTVCPGKITKTGAHLLAAAWRVHEFIKQRAITEVRRVMLHERASFPRSALVRMTGRTLPALLGLFPRFAATQTLRLQRTYCRIAPEYRVSKRVHPCAN